MPQGQLKHPVLFRVHKPISGIPYYKYRKDGTLAVRDVRWIAMLHRLPDDHCEEITDEPESDDIEAAGDSVDDMDWGDQIKLASELGVFRFGMKGPEVVTAIKEAMR